MAPNTNPGPLPLHEGGPTKTGPIRLFRRFARTDPQLYPLSAIMLATAAVAGYFIYQRSQEIERTPNKIDRHPGKPSSGSG
ncbi:hypothetical protein FRB94_003128 [Tulasnella sp. JGI-2019a]|nr:hypothetical protein FRB94_003128 [Tulasnella sp. JGI-2019a]KAG9017812.1 hypothetical protein FRB93_004623 [Tulasnella sp. JGI-2019a]KAG9035436.1 hypothetical protein FRB95_011301 [Tulasnella sp. JGI-2019a]